MFYEEYRGLIQIIFRLKNVLIFNTNCFYIKNIYRRFVLISISTSPLAAIFIRNHMKTIVNILSIILVLSVIVFVFFKYGYVLGLITLGSVLIGGAVAPALVRLANR